MRAQNKTATLALLAFAMLIVSLDQYIVVVALPEIGRGLDFTAQTLQAVISAYAVASAAFLLLGGRASDVLGRRRVFVTGLSLYAGASLLGGLASAPETLLASRAVQGLGGALVFPSTLSLVNTTFAEGHERNGAVAVWGGAGAAGLVIGVLLGGVLTHALGWEAVFFVNVPLATLTVALAFVLIPADGSREDGRSFDLPGALSATLGITLIVFALVEGPNLGWSSAPVLACATAGVLASVAFALIESRSQRAAAAATAAGQPQPGHRGGHRLPVLGHVRLGPLLPDLVLPGRPRLRRPPDRRRLPGADGRGRGVVHARRRAGHPLRAQADARGRARPRRAGRAGARA